MMTLKNKVAAEFFFQKASMEKKKIEKKMQKASSRFIFLEESCRCVVVKEVSESMC